MSTTDGAVGLCCRECGSRYFRVISTRHALGDRIIRRRVCRYCGRAMVTVERELGREAKPAANAIEGAARPADDDPMAGLQIEPQTEEPDNEQ